MNLEFSKVGVGRAQNKEGAVVRGYAKEMLIYERGAFSLPFEISYLADSAVIYIPKFLPHLPSGCTEEDLVAEILAGAQVVARRNVELGGR